MEIAMLILAAIAAVAGVITALPPLGVDIGIFGRPHMPLEGIPHFRARQARIAIVVALISLGISAGAFYYFFRPRVVEKIIEKPVDRIVEKSVPAPCPPAKTNGAKANKSTITTPTYAVQNPTGSIVNQGSPNLGTQTVNNGPVPRHLSDITKEELAGCFGKKHGVFKIGAITNNSEAYAYAKEWRDLLVSAKWKGDEADIPPINSVFLGGGNFSGTMVSIHDAALFSQTQMVIANGSPERNFSDCLAGRHDLPGGVTIVPHKEFPSGSVSIIVSDQPPQP
jgi:hypothetical protein